VRAVLDRRQDTPQQARYGLFNAPVKRWRRVDAADLCQAGVALAGAEGAL
jgi:hypothetical protein